MICFTASARLSAAMTLGRSVVLVLIACVAIDSARALDLTVGPKQVIYTTKQRKRKNLATWPDGNLGVVANGQGGYDFYGANGPKPVKTTGTLTDLGQTKKSVSITNLPAKTFDYVSGGPVYRDPATGARLMIYHAEKHSSGAKNFHSVLGLAISTDVNGLTFRDLGTIIEPNLQTGLAEVGGGSFAVVDNYLHVYYRDWFPNGTTSEVAVARAPISDLIGNALGGQSTLFNKYYNGSWDQPGRGGLSSPLEIGNPGTSWLAASHNDYLNQLVMVTSQWESGGGDLYLSTSPDGVNWSARQPLALDAGEQFYPSLIGTGPDPTHTGQSFFVYYTDSQKGAWSRWKDAQLVRREITINQFTAPVAAPIEPPPANTNWTQVAGYQAEFQSGSPANGWTYGWNPTGPGSFAPLLWSNVAQGYNTTGAATTLPGTTTHNDDYLLLQASGGHPGNPNYLPIVGYTIQPDDGAGIYRLTDSSIAKSDGILSPGEDGLEVVVYLNNAQLGPAQHVATSGLTASFDRDLGELNIGDTIWVMVSPLNNQFYDAFNQFNFTIQKGVPSSQAASSSIVPEPCASHLLLVALAVYQYMRNRREQCRASAS